MIEAIRDEFVALKTLADRAIAQVDDEGFFAQLDTEANSVAVLMKHVGGNLRSRWTDVFTSDGEKPDRHRDREFERRFGETRATIEHSWETGWGALADTLSSLVAEDLARTVVIRGEPHTLARALTRSLGHTAGHVHQIVMLAKHWCGDGWKTLSIPRAVAGIPDDTTGRP
jgi:hypothetical protein